MQLDWQTLTLQTVNFAILVWLLQRFLYRPVLRIVDARRAEVQSRTDAAAAAESQAKAQLAAIETQRAGIAAEREAALREAAAQAERAARERASRADADAAAVLDKARSALAAERAHALTGLQRDALELGADVARRLLDQMPAKLRAEAWMERIDAQLATLSSEDREGLVPAGADQTGLTVVTAAPLSAENAEDWRVRLRRRFGERLAISFIVDEALVAGAELHFPTAILRFSWQSVLAAIRSDMDAHADAR